MPKYSQYVGLDVSLKETSICVIDDADKIGWRGQVESTPETIASAVKQHAPHAVRIGLESGQLSNWLFHGLKEAGLPMICVDARHAKAALSLKVNKTDAADALGLAQIMRVGWYREVTVKGLDCQAVRALLVGRGKIVARITSLKNCVRGPGPRRERWIWQRHQSTRVQTKGTTRQPSALPARDHPVCRRAQSCQGAAWKRRSAPLWRSDGPALTASARAGVGNLRSGRKKACGA